MDHRHRSSETLELVWTGPSAAGFGFRRTDQALLEVISRATRCLYVVSFVAYKVPHVAEALVRAAERGVAIHLILESEKESERRVTFSALEALGPQVVARSRVYCWPVERRQRSPSGVLPSLHAKCAVADGKVLFISSANLTEHAHDYNMELGVLIVGGELPSQVEAHLEGLIESGVLILETT
jgi:phosphatidylserine/phosphatidylglycerophosphate/cardiolipin synthase-like enzyme